VRVVISRRAINATERIDQHWRDHADDPVIFAREFQAAIAPRPDVSRDALRNIGVSHEHVSRWLARSAIAQPYART